MSHTNGRSLGKNYVGGFTLVELIVAMSLSAMLFAGIFGGFTFLGRNLTRLVSTQDQDAKSRRAFSLFGQDISAAANFLETPSDTALRVQVQAAHGPSVVDYTYDPVARTLSRTIDATAPTILLSNLSSFSFRYFNQAGDLLVLKSGQQLDLTRSSAASIKEIELSFASAAGNLAAGTQSVFSGTSPRFLLRNRPLLQ